MSRISNLWERARSYFTSENKQGEAAQKRRPASIESLEDRTTPTGNLFTPVYQATFTDALTQDNAIIAANGQRYWTVDEGADNYQIDLYERPTDEEFKLRKLSDGTKVFAADRYFENLDIKQGQAGFDENYMYVSIEMAGQNESTSSGRNHREGLDYQYGFRISNNADGGRGYLITVDAPGCGWRSTKFSGDDTEIHFDKNGDVGGTGLDVTREDRFAEQYGNGYEKDFARNGRTKNGAKVVWARINPDNPNAVEFVLDYKALGFTASDLSSLPYFDFQASRCMGNSEKMMWNDEFTKREAGSPNANANGNGKSEFGTYGLGRIHTVDTMRGGPIGTVEPGTGSISGTVFLDSSDDGIIGDGETGIAGVVLTLSGTDDLGNTVTMTATTDANGNYTFANLRAGTYQITETQPIEFADGIDNVGDQGGSVDNDYLFDIVLADGVSASGYTFGEIEFMPF